jgi:hypothetical protein
VAVVLAGTLIESMKAFAAVAPIAALTKVRRLSFLIGPIPCILV